MSFEVRGGFVCFSPAQRLQPLLGGDIAEPQSAFALRAHLCRELSHITRQITQSDGQIDLPKMVQALSSIYNGINPILDRFGVPKSGDIREAEEKSHRRDQDNLTSVEEGDLAKKHLYETRLRLSSTMIRDFAQMIDRRDPETNPATLWNAWVRFLPAFPIVLDWSVVETDLSLKDLSDEIICGLQLLLPGERLWVLLPAHGLVVGDVHRAAGASGAIAKTLSQTGPVKKSFDTIAMGALVLLKAKVKTLSGILLPDGSSREIGFLTPDHAQQRSFGIQEHKTPVEFKFLS